MADARTRLTAEDKEHLTKLEEALFEIRRVIAGQEEMLERLLLCLLAGGHLLIEGVPGLAKTLAIKSTASVLGGSFARDPVHARPGAERPRRHEGLPPGQARLRHRARPRLLQLPARRRDQPRAGQGAVGAARGDAGAAGDDRPHDASGARTRSSCSRPRTRSSPRAPTRCPRRRSTASCSRCSSTIPSHDEELTVVARSLEPAVELYHGALDRAAEGAPGDGRARSSSIPALVSWVVDLATATRKPAEHGLEAIAPYISYGASPRGPISVIAAARALAVLRQRDYVLPSDVEAVVRDAFRHRLVLSYQALAEEVSADQVLDQVLAAFAPPQIDLGRPATAVA